jgi:hypothetical protein
MENASAEERLAALETNYQQALQRIATLEARLPDSNIISRKFLSRAFAVWGHTFVAQLIIIVPIYVIIILFSILGSLAYR